MMKFSLAIIGLIFLCSACSFQPEPINYGVDNCHFCQMTIVDQAFAAQLVTDKGKQYKYDAIECMVHDIFQKDYQTSFILVANYDKPGNMLPVTEAGFVQHDSLRSPMGANLAAVKKQSRKGGNLQAWEELKNQLN
ncbi:copper chaperone NosL [Salegentibacter sp. 24]|uniref:nitrous oxide reductase accessory protein NosL n=1 Tax=Salegentibacter sp. 24 TaxID=2183986 RepID=UPI0010618740|nr:nitrous oxide reductase accessory protein NosL [Salegentibacter sp. 24]TDN83857.1 copper chaperone NosL [Salegentibacter sp. 24]